MAQIDLTRDNIQAVINAAHLQIAKITDTAASRYFRGVEEKDLLNPVFQAINIIKVLEDDTKLTDDEVELFLDRLIKLTKAFEVGFEGTTLQIVKNQPALVTTNILGTVSGTPFTLIQYNANGDDISPSAILMGGGSSILHQGSVYEIGYEVATSDARLIRAGGTASNVSLDITSKGTGQLRLAGGDILLDTSTKVSGNLTLAIGNSVNSITADLSTSASSNELADAFAIKTYADTLDTAARAYTDSLVVDANNGLDKTGTLIQLGGGLIIDTDISMGSSQEFKISSTGDTEEFIIQPTVGFTIKSLGGSIQGTQTDIQIIGGVLNYAADQSGSYTLRSTTDKSYQDNHIGGQLVASNVLNPTVTEDDFSITWDNALQRYILKTKGTAGGIADASTLNGYTAAEFLKSQEADSKIQKQTYDLTALSGTAGRSFIDVTVSADQVGTGAQFSLTNTDRIIFYDNTNTREAIIDAYSLDLSIPDGTPPIVTSSTTLVTNLNADQVDGADASYANTANNIVVRNASNDIQISSINGTPIASYLTTGVVAATANELLLRSPSGVAFATQFNPSGAGLTQTDIYLTRNGTSAEIRAAGVSTFFNTANGRTAISASTTGVQINEDLYVNGAIFALSSDITAFSSDIRKKENIEMLDGKEALDKIRMINPVSFNWIHSGEKSRGFIAQEMKNIIPEAVVDGGDDGYFLSLPPIVAELMAGVKALQEEVAFLRSQLK